MTSGCAVHKSSRPYTKDTKPGHEKEVRNIEKDGSRSQASKKYTDKGYNQLKHGDTEAAISSLERAVSINPRDGKAYYHLAEAWMVKKDIRLATQYNKLALIHLRGDSKWSSMAEKQKKRISSARK